MNKKSSKQRIINKALMLLLCLSVALISIFGVGKYATSPECYNNTIQSIDEKKAIVMGVSTGAVVTATAIASVPGDATTPIANKLMDMSSYLLIVVCALALEKSLLTVFGYLAFKIFIPIACTMFAMTLFWKHSLLKILAMKIVVFALVISTIVPLSFKISDLIYEMNKTAVTELNLEVEEMDDTEDEDKKWWESIADTIKKSASNVGEKAKEILNDFIDVIAIFIISYCAIPIVVFSVVIWFVKMLFNIKISIPSKEQFPTFKKVKKEDNFITDES